MSNPALSPSGEKSSETSTAPAVDMKLEVVAIPVAKRDGGRHDENWPDWYAEYMAAELAGKELPL